MRVLLDTNILISYLLHRSPASPVTTLVEAAILGDFTLLLPESLLEELSARVSTKRYLTDRITPEEFRHLSALLLAQGELIPRFTEATPAVTRDPKDDYLLAYAIIGEADFLVTGDEDLLVLREVRGMKILRPREFVEEVLKS